MDSVSGYWQPFSFALCLTFLPSECEVFVIRGGSCQENQAVRKCQLPSKLCFAACRARVKR